MPFPVVDPALCAGWEADAPVSDSLLRRFLVNWTLAVEAEGESLGGRIFRRDDIAAVDVGRPGSFHNVATLTMPLFPEGAGEVMAVLDDFYHFPTDDALGKVFLFSPWPTPDLRTYGWAIVEYLPLMLRPAGGAPPPLPPGLRIEKVTDKRGVRDFETASVRGFSSSANEDEGAGSLLGNAILDDERMRMWVGFEDDRPVSAASTFIEAGINDVTLVATVPEARRRGYGAALTWHATLADPALPSLLLATNDGLPVYEGMGYVTLFRFALWSRDRPTESSSSKES